ncbi:endonuclease [Streptomyces sp. TRM64462]|uniref:endonuclease n=1 Tax=Streptomyces sp. TRM64462 TaxID=2741726 RepID=UPI001585FE7E|nr:endonuclease [Streptomyces sp. TRM64462]
MSPSDGKRTGRTKEQRETARELLDAYGHTYAEAAGIRLKDTPQPLYQLLVLAHLLSARIRADIAVAAARALFEAGLRDPRHMKDASWQQRVDALGEGGYRRYDERTSTQLGKAAELVLEEYRGDLRRMHKEAGGDPGRLRRLLQEVPGIGPAGADIFLREAQAVWPDLAPYLDDRTLDGAKRLGLPADRDKLAGLVKRDELPTLAAALVRAAIDRHVVEEVRETRAKHTGRS